MHTFIQYFSSRIFTNHKTLMLNDMQQDVSICDMGVGCNPPPSKNHFLYRFFDRRSGNIRWKPSNSTFALKNIGNLLTFQFSRHSENA